MMTDLACGLMPCAPSQDPIPTMKASAAVWAISGLTSLALLEAAPALRGVSSAVMKAPFDDLGGCMLFDDDDNDDDGRLIMVLDASFVYFTWVYYRSLTYYHPCAPTSCVHRIKPLRFLNRFRGASSTVV